MVIRVAIFTRRPRTIAVALGAIGVGSLPWLIPAGLHTVYADPAGVAAFAARADTPFGSLGSLVMLGGSWNATKGRAPRGQPLDHEGRLQQRRITVRGAAFQPGGLPGFGDVEYLTGLRRELGP